MATNFPSNPSDGDTHEFGGVTYTYSATKTAWTGASGGGSSTFVGLSDTPSDFTNAGGKSVAVNSGATALEFVDASSGSGVTNYTNFAAFPGSPSEGDLAYAEDTNALYIYNGAAWDRISSGANETPEFSTSPNGSYFLATDGTATTVTVAATDPEGFDITYSHDTSPSNQTQATITNSGGTFTITPTTTQSNAGSFNLRFKASDGVHVSSKVSEFTLGFSEEWFGEYYESSTGLLASQMAIDSDDNIYIVGNRDTGSGSIGRITKINKYGTLKWTKLFESTESNATATYLYSIAIDSNDNIYVGGAYYGSPNAAIVIKYNTSGAVQWAKKLVNSAGNYTFIGQGLNHIAISPDDNTIILKYRHNSGVNASYYSHSLHALNTSGTIQWSKVLGQTDAYDWAAASGHTLPKNASNSIWYIQNPSFRYSLAYNDSTNRDAIGVATQFSDGSFWHARYQNQWASHDNGVEGTSSSLGLDSPSGYSYNLYKPESGTTGGRLGMYGVSYTGNNWGSSQLQMRIHYATASSEPYFGVNGTHRPAVDSTSIYAGLDIWYSSTGSTIGYQGAIVQYSKTNPSSTSWLGKLSFPSSTNGTGIYSRNVLVTSSGKLLCLFQLLEAGSSTQSFGIMSMNPSSVPATNTTLGVNSDITWNTGTPAGITNTLVTLNGSTNTNTLTVTNDSNWAGSSLTNTTGTATLTSDYEDLS